MTADMVRTAEPQDLDAIERLENGAFTHDRLSRRSLRRLLTGRRSRFLVTPRHGPVAGYALLLFRTGAATARLYSIAVDPQKSRLGLGRTLLCACEAEAATHGCTALRLEVHTENARAIQLYRSRGYEVFGRLEAYYQDGGAALRLQKGL